MLAEFVVPPEARTWRSPEHRVACRDLNPPLLGRRRFLVGRNGNRDAPLAREVVQDVAEGLRVHEPVLDRHLQGVEWRARQQFVHLLAHLVDVSPRLLEARPVFGAIGRELARRRVDAEREQVVERGVNGAEAQRPAPNQVPVERLDVPEVEEDAMTLGDRAVEVGFRSNLIEKAVGEPPRAVDGSCRVRGLNHRTSTEFAEFGRDESHPPDARIRVGGRCK